VCDERHQVAIDRNQVASAEAQVAQILRDKDTSRSDECDSNSAHDQPKSRHGQKEPAEEELIEPIILSQRKNQDQMVVASRYELRQKFCYP